MLVKGTIVNATKRFYNSLEKAEENIKEQLKKSEVLHVDETGMRSLGKLNWVHTASTEYLTHYAIHDKRGTKATKDIDILPNFTGTMVHDHWKPYYTFTDSTHAECNAHHMRNLKGIHENLNHQWAQDMGSLLVEIKKAVDAFKEKGSYAMAENDMKNYIKRYNCIIAKGKKEDAKQKV